MIRFIRRAMDAERLTLELEKAQDEIDALKREMSSRPLGPSFREVAKDFDATAIFSLVSERVVDDISPFLEREAIKMLKDAFRGLEKDRGGLPMMTAHIAEDYAAQVLQVVFDVDRMGTSIRVANFK